MRSPDDIGLDDDTTLLGAAPGADGTDPLALFESEEELNRPGHSTQENPGRSAQERSTSGDVVPHGVSVVLFPTRPPASPLRVQSPIAIEVVLSRLGHIEWAEAVAVVEAVSEFLMTDGRERVPEVSDLSITAEGTVTVKGQGAKGVGGALLARLIHKLTASGTMPAPLRLFVTKWAASAEIHSIAEFARELAYFTRGDGQTLIRALYDRADRAIAPPPQPAMPLQQRRPTTAPKPPLPDRSHASGSPRWRLYGVAAAVVVLATLLTALFAWRSSPPSVQAPVLSLAMPPPDPVRVASLARDDIGSRGGIVAPESTSLATAGLRGSGVSAPGPAPAASVTSPPPTGPSGARRPTSVSTPAGSAAARASLAAAASATLTPGSRAPAEPSRAALRAGPPAMGGRSAAQESPLYSRDDADVTPPVFVHLQLPSPLLSGLRPDMNTIELIVSQAGLVERVRLLSTPKRMADMMLLSGAKNWEFQPATRGGEPVRYRLEVSWAATP